MSDPLALAENHLDSAGLLDEPSAVLYSGASTLVRGPVYLLGLNPGGSESLTIGQSIAASRREHNCYLDEQWAPGGHLQPMGQSTLQRRVQRLCAIMGLDTRKVPASNLVFTRSTRISTHSGFRSAAKACLAVHNVFLDAILPDMIVTYGNISNFHGLATVRELESRSADHGIWQANRGIATVRGRDVRIGNIPHMSLWASDKREHVVRWALGLD